MTAKEWCVKNEITNIELDDPEILMERYANYRLKELEAKILDFRVRLPLYSCYATSFYDKHFNITTERNGTI